MALWVRSRRDGHGETAAFELLWERHAQATHGAVVRVLGPHRSLADEVFQDAWLEVTRATEYRPGSFRGFIVTIATRKALDRLATSAVRHAGAEEPDQRVPAAAAGPQDDAEARQGAGVVLQIVERLPDVQRVAWTLRYVEEMTFEEVAEAMGTALGTAKTRVRLANAFIADALEEAGLKRSDFLGEG